MYHSNIKRQIKIYIRNGIVEITISLLIYNNISFKNQHINKFVKNNRQNIRQIKKYKCFDYYTINIKKILNSKNANFMIK